MQDTTIIPKGNHPKREWHFPRAVEVFYPSKIRSTADRHNWIAAMILDSRLSDRDKVVLTRLALHMNLETGRLDPTMDLLALETSLHSNQASARRMARRCIEHAEKLGWIERTSRNAGYRFNRSNSYRLRIPKDIHPDKSDWSSGQIELVVRTPQSGRIGKVNTEGYLERGGIRGRGLRASAQYSLKELGLVREILAEGPLTVSGLIQRADNLGSRIDAGAIGQMVVDHEIEFDGGNVALSREAAAPTDVGARLDEVET
jgi:hypothetical protein